MAFYVISNKGSDYGLGMSAFTVLFLGINAMVPERLLKMI